MGKPLFAKGHVHIYNIIRKPYNRDTSEGEV